MKKIVKFFTKNEFLAGVMVLVAIARIPSLFEPNWYGDEGVYLLLGQALKQGLVWYRDIHDNKPPLLYLLAAVSGSVMYFRALLLVWMMATLVVFDKLAKVLIDKRRLQKAALAIFALLSTLPAIEGNIANAEIFMILPTLLGFWFFLKNEGDKNYFWSGIFFSLAFLFKVPAVFELAGLIFFSILFARKNIKDYLLILLGFVLPIGITAIYYWSQGALGDYYFAALAQNLGYLSSWRSGSFSQGVGTQSGLLLRGLILLITVGLFWLSNRKEEKRYNLVWIWFIFSVFAALLSERPYPHYLIQVVASGSFLLVMSGFDRFRRWFWLTVGLGVIVVAVVTYRFYFYPTLPYYRNFMLYLSGKIGQEKYNDYFDWRVNRTINLATYLKHITAPNEKIFVWGDEPFVYVAANRLPLGKYVVAYHIVDFAAMNEIGNRLGKEMPKAIVVSEREREDFPQLKNLLVTNYVLVKRFDDAKVYFRLDHK